MPVADDDHGVFLALAIPKYAREGVANDLYEAVRAYRLGNFGHDMPEINRCLSILDEVIKKTKELSPEDAYLAHYVRGRCAAEAYETMLAIESFRVALEMKPDDFNTNMSLLAELSIAALNPDIQPKAQWETAYVQQWQLVKDKFPTQPAVTNLASLLFDEKRAGDKPLTPEEIQRGKRLGFGVFRWKER